MLPQPSDLITALQQEITLIDSLLQTLNNEKQALLTRQFEQLETLSAEKQALSKQLEESARGRVALLCDTMDPMHYNSRLVSYLAQCTTEQAQEIQTLNTTLAEKIVLCREHNLINGQVITSNLNTRQEIVNALTGQERLEASKTYTAKGGIKKNGDAGRYQEV